MSQTNQFISPYRLVVGVDPAIIEAKVSAFLREGYVLHGNLNMSIDMQSKRHFSQVLVLPSVKIVDQHFTICHKTAFTCAEDDVELR